MASTTAYNSLKSAIQTGISPIPVLDFDQIEPALQQGSDSFTVLEENTEQEILAAFGGNLCHREIGILVVHAFAPAPEANAAARSLAESVQDLLRSQVLSNGLRIFEVDPPSQSVSNDGLWTAYTIAVNYELDTTRSPPAPLP
jgi:hypothetical protein